jgi:hypothetical protein
MLSMTYEEFQSSLTDESPPQDLPPLAAAMWWDAKGDWARAHEIAQELTTADAAWIHAYLHRKEGETSNAAYWYGKAGKPLCLTTFKEEWIEIVQRMIGR